MDQFFNAVPFEEVEAQMEQFGEGLSKKDDPKENVILFCAKLVEALLLTQINPELSVTKANLELALHQQEVIRNFIWAWGFQIFLKFWLSHIRPIQTDDPTARRILEKRNEKALSLLRNEKVHPTTRLLIRRTLESVKVGLMELVRTVHPKEGSDKQSRYRRRVKEMYLELFDDVGAWSFEMKGKGPDLEIEAGEALKEFSRLVYMPLSIRQTAFFGDLVSKGKGEES
jgi:hypothetical protein